MDQIVLRNITKRFATRTMGDVTAVDHFNLSVREGECFSFLGPSGCGKSTTLRLIAGFEEPSEGEIEIGGRPVSVSSQNLCVPPEERGLGMVFQSYAVWPHMNVFENVAFPLRIQKTGREETGRRVKEALEHVGLSGLESRFPADLSGGQQQRIALARAIVTRPKTLLLDEPLSNLDPMLRESMRFEIRKLQKKLNLTVIFVTHDQAEAMAVSDRMMVCDMGKIIQTGTPEELYNRPNSRFVYGFLGESDFLNVVIKDGKAYAEGDLDHALPIPVPSDAKERMTVATRPNLIGLSGPGEDGYPSHIEKRIFLPDSTEYLVPAGGQILKVRTPHRVLFSEGEACAVRFAAPVWFPYED